MPPTELPPSPIPSLRTVKLNAEHVPALQRFFEANPEYSLAVNGEPAGPNDAHEEIHGELPQGWSFTKRWLVGYLNEQGEMVAMANVVSDLLAPSVWHIGLFMVATAQHGTGLAQELCHGLESWSGANGASWLRLGVVQGNARAERFWVSLDLIETRTRSGIQMGARSNTVRVMVKPLRAGTLEQYLSLVERDRPEKHNAL